MSTPDFIALTSRNHRPSSMSEIKPRPALKQNTRNKGSTVSSHKSNDKSKVKSVDDGKASSSNSGDRKKISGADDDVKSTRTFYKLNPDGTLVPLPASKSHLYGSMDIDHSVDTSIYITDEAESTDENISESQRVSIKENHDYERRKQMFMKKQKVKYLESQERETDLLISELVSKTPTYTSLVTDDSSKDEDADDDDDNQNNNNKKPPEVIVPHLRMSHKSRIQLDNKRKLNESSIPSQFHGINLDDWIDQIDWEGCRTSNEKSEPMQSDDYISKSSQNYAQEILSQKYNPALEALDLTSGINWEGVGNVPKTKTPLILHESVACQSIARYTIPQKRPQSFNQTQEFEQRHQRSITGVGKSSYNTKNEEREQLIEEKQRKRKQMVKDKRSRVQAALGTLELGGGKGRTITSSLMGPGGTERTGRPSRHENNSSAHDSENIEQLDIVSNHSLVKPDPRTTEVRLFYRPRLPPNIVNVRRPWKFQIHVFSSKNKMSMSSNNVHVVGSYMMNNSRGLSSVNKIETVADLTLNKGSLVLFEYCEERPPLQMSKGMACRVVNYYRGDKSCCPISAGGGDRPIRKRAANLHDSNAVTLGASGKAEKPQKLVGPEVANGISLLDLIGIDISKKKKNMNENEKKSTKDKPAVDVLPEGATEILHAKVHGPFIGQIEEGTTQTSLISKLFAAPIFRHEPEQSDFLMILGKKPNFHKQRQQGGDFPIDVTLRPLPSSVFTVGQTEPRVKVFAPNSTTEKDFLKAFVNFQVAKALDKTQQRDGHGLKLDEIKECVFPYTPHAPNYLRGRLKQVANHDKNTQNWTTKEYGEDNYQGVEYLGTQFSPESVAAYESTRAALQRLSDMGIENLESGVGSVANVGAAMIFLNAGATAARERKNKMAKIRDHRKRDKSTPERLLALYDKAVQKLEEDSKNKKHMQAIARFIYEEMQLAPWHLTSEFIDVHKNNHGTAMMKLTGLGDPSGRGEAFNFLRETDAKPNKETGNSDGALNAQIKKITGTENDLRRLTMKQMASLLRSYGLDQSKINSLKRWDRVHVIRELSTKSANDGTHDGLERFARGEKMKLSEQKQMYRDRIQEIWRRQIAALTTDTGTFDTKGGEKNNEGASAKEDDFDDDDFDFDDDDDEDFIKNITAAINDERKTKKFVKENVMESGSSSINMTGPHGVTEDEVELMKWKQQRDEEKKIKSSLKKGSSKDDDSSFGGSRQKHHGKKVIRRKITKTYPDGRQTTTFRFFVLKNDIQKAKEEKKQKEQEKLGGTKGGRGSKLRKEKKKASISLRDETGFLGVHSLFEEDDSKKRSGQKLRIRRITTSTKDKSSRSYTKSSKNSFPKNDKQKLKEKMDRREKKRMREQDESDIYSLASQRGRGTSNRRERGSARDRMPHLILSDRFESIRLTIERRPSSGPFHRPIGKEERYYHEIIKNPIDLQTIREKNSRYEYRTADSFLEDFELMKDNAIQFNSEGSMLAEEATEIYEAVRENIEASRDEFDSMEAAVKTQLGLGSGKPTKKARLSQSKSSNDSVSSKGSASSDKIRVASEATSVVLDGIETTVNLGDIGDFDFGDDSD